MAVKHSYFFFCSIKDQRALIFFIVNTVRRFRCKRAYWLFRPALIFLFNTKIVGYHFTWKEEIQVESRHFCWMSIFLGEIKIWRERRVCYLLSRRKRFSLFFVFLLFCPGSPRNSKTENFLIRGRWILCLMWTHKSR